MAVTHVIKQNIKATEMRILFTRNVFIYYNTQIELIIIIVLTKLIPEAGPKADIKHGLMVQNCVHKNSYKDEALILFIKQFVQAFLIRICYLRM